jgi:hypothetical protein
MIHEHQNPTGGIQWNRENVIQTFGANNWIWLLLSKISETYAREQINGTTLDKIHHALCDPAH